MHRMNQMRTLLQQALALAQRLAHLTDFPVLQVAKPTVNNSCGTAGGAGGKVVLLDQKCASSGTCALACDCDSVYSAANNDDLEAFAFQRSPGWAGEVHV